MIKITSEKTFKIIKYILLKKAFKQRETANKTKVSLGRVNLVINWLLEKGYIEKFKGEYRLLSPLGILKLISLDRNVEKITTLKVDINKEKLMKYLKTKKIVFCGITALQFYSSYFRDPRINFYADNIERLEELKSLPSGNIIINIYKPDLSLKEDTEKKQGILLTSKLRTVIDLHCGDMAYAAKDLIEELWGVKIG